MSVLERVQVDRAEKEGRGHDELEAIAGDAVAESGASSPKEMGKVMSVAMPKVGGRADGKRVSEKVREALSG
jgi:uncharacterized protein